jgi:RNA-binding protein 39
MFDPATETEPDWDKEIKEDVVAECKGNVLHAYVEKDLPGGMVYLLFDQTSDAEAAAEGMNGRWFAGRMITVRYLARQEHCAKFPETKEVRVW